MFYNPINGLLGQWKDDKVVSFISTLPLVGNSTTMQQSGSKKMSFSCPKTLQEYNESMGYVDLIDYDKKVGGYFMQKRSFKKWYKKGCIGIMDFMLVHGHVTWNMSANFFRTMIAYSTWKMYVAKLMLNCKDPMVECERTILSRIPKSYCLRHVKRFVIYNCIQNEYHYFRNHIFPCGVRILYDFHEFVSSPIKT